jgi:hypothetical protein
MPESAFLCDSVSAFSMTPGSLTDDAAISEENILTVKKFYLIMPSVELSTNHFFSFLCNRIFKS